MPHLAQSGGKLAVALRLPQQGPHRIATIAGSNSHRKSSSGVGYFRVSGKRPPPLRRIPSDLCGASNSRRPRWIVLRATPVARETR
jgi:hypothetical protein